MADSPKTILAIGAHYDDCVFGIPGILLQAVQKKHRVVILSLIGDYTNWPRARNRSRELKETSTSLAHYVGVEMRFLNYASGRFHPNDDAAKAVAQVVADVRPDIAFALWHQDRHPDHESASAISKKALRLGGPILGDEKFKVPSQIYFYDNGPGHTIGFEPNTFVDVSNVWASAAEWLGQLMAFVNERPYEESAPGPAVAAKTTLAQYRGLSCGARYAEAVWALHAKTSQLF